MLSECVRTRNPRCSVLRGRHCRIPFSSAQKHTSVFPEVALCPSVRLQVSHCVAPQEVVSKLGQTLVTQQRYVNPKPRIPQGVPFALCPSVVRCGAIEPCTASPLFSLTARSALSKDAWLSECHVFSITTTIHCPDVTPTTVFSHVLHLWPSNKRSFTPRSLEALIACEVRESTLFAQ